MHTESKAYSSDLLLEVEAFRALESQRTIHSGRSGLGQWAMTSLLKATLGF